MTSPSQARMLDAPELNTDETFIIVEDFVTAVVGAFMPEAEPWCERGPGMDLPGGARAGLAQGPRPDQEGRPGDLRRDEGVKPLS